MESTFGILTHRFPVIFGPIRQSLPNAIKTVKCCIILHNYLNRTIGANREDDIQEEEDVAITNDPLDTVYVAQNPDPNEQRIRLGKYFMTPEGSIQAFDQRERVNRSSRRHVGVQDVGGD